MLILCGCKYDKLVDEKSSRGGLEVEQWSDNRTLYLGGPIPAVGTKYCVLGL